MMPPATDCSLGVPPLFVLLQVRSLVSALVLVPAVLAADDADDEDDDAFKIILTVKDLGCYEQQEMSSVIHTARKQYGMTLYVRV